MSYRLSKCCATCKFAGDVYDGTAFCNFGQTNKDEEGLYVDAVGLCDYWKLDKCAYDETEVY